MDFTIITPSFNYARYIADCLQSVASQEGVTFEHLIMDACSTDNTAEIVSQFPHATFYQESDNGMSDAINKGFQKAKGRWVMWLNADDFLATNALKSVLDFVSSRPDLDVVFGTYNFVDKDGKKIRTMRLLPYSLFISLHYGCYVPSTSTFFRRATTISDGLILDDRLKTVMDNEYYARLSLAGRKFAYYPRVLAGFRIHDANLSHVGGVKHGTFDDAFQNAKMGIESEAIRRTYGVSLFSNSVINHALDFFLYFVAWVLKGLFKLPFWLQTKTK